MGVTDATSLRILIRAFAMATMVQAAEEYKALRRAPEGEESMSAGYMTCFDPCIMPRRQHSAEREEQLTPDAVAHPRYPADEQGEPIAMEAHAAVLPSTPVGFLTNRFRGSSLADLKAEHEGVEEKLDAKSAREQ